MRIDMDPQWMIIVRIPDGRHAIAKMLPEEPMSTLQLILSKKVQALSAIEPHQFNLRAQKCGNLIFGLHNFK